MKKAISNILLVLLLIAFILISTGFVTLLIQGPSGRLTGAATGVTNLSIQSLASIRLIRNVSDFGSGNPIPGGILNITTNQTNTNGFNNGSEGNGTDYGEGTHVYPFVVENDGNDDTTCVNVTAQYSASTFIGGTGPIFRLASRDNETGSCAAGLKTSWTDVTTSPITVCSSLHTETGGGGANTIRIHWWIGIPYDAPNGTKNNTITVSGHDNC
ncbi:MAG: hypothetical protein QW754_06140 [Thermoplasmata archaeon]